MANLEHIDILYEGADAWNNWRKESPQIKPDISKCDLYKVSRYWMFAHISITSKELNFSETDMREVRFKGMNEFIFDFTHSNLSNVDLSQRKLRWANLNNADLSYAQLRGTNLFRAKLIDAKLTNTNLTHANLIEAELNNAELHYANLNKAKLCRAKLIKSNLYKANLSGAKLGNSDMRNADLRGADLSNTNLYSVNIQKAYFDEETIFPQDFNPLNAGMIYLSVDYENSNLIEKLLINKKEKKYINPPPRPGQVEFRENVRKAYDNKCAISGCGIEEVLEAAHIMPWMGNHSHEVWNGLLLRSDIHKLLDAYLVAIHPETNKIIIHPSLKESYPTLNNPDLKLRTPTDKSLAPKKDILKYHFNRCREKGWIKD